MSARSRLRSIVLGLALAFGAMAGAAKSPEEIEQAMSQESQSKIVYVLEQEDD